MEYDLEIMHFAVGQGLCVSVTLTDGYNVFLGILDMGGDQVELKTECLEYLSIIIKQNSGSINYVLVSHQDSDHYCLFKNLADYYSSKYGEKITIQKLLLGISPGNENGDPALSIFNSNFILPENSYYYVYNDMIYHSNSDPFSPVIWSQNDIDINIDLNKGNIFQIHCLLGGAFYLNDFTINTGSVIALVSIFNTNTKKSLFSYLFTGDATCNTLAVFNNLKFDFSASRDRHVLVPHHGSYPTMSGDKFESLQEFLHNYKPTAAYVSAKANASLKHPSAEILSHFLNYVEESKQSRNITAVNQDGSVSVFEPIKKQILCTYRLPIQCNEMQIRLCREFYSRKNLMIS